MTFELHRAGDTPVAELVEPNLVLSTTGDALDLFANARHLHGASHVIVRRDNLPAEFFDLKSGLAGEILQKVSNYRLRLAILGDYTDVPSGPLHDFIWESNRAGTVLFVAGVEEALARLAE